MELAPRIHEGHSKGRTVPGSRADSTHSLGRWFRRNCISFKTILFPPVEQSEVLIAACQEVLMLTSLPSLRTAASSQQFISQETQPSDTTYFPKQEDFKEWLFIFGAAAQMLISTCFILVYSQPISPYLSMLPRPVFKHQRSDFSASAVAVTSGVCSRTQLRNGLTRGMNGTVFRGQKQYVNVYLFQCEEERSSKQNSRII